MKRCVRFDSNANNDMLTTARRMRLPPAPSPRYYDIGIVNRVCDMSYRRRTESGSTRGSYTHFRDHHVDDVSDVMTSFNTSMKRLADPQSTSSSINRNN